MTSTVSRFSPVLATLFLATLGRAAPLVIGCVHG
jgi:hypothetical protein